AAITVVLGLAAVGFAGLVPGWEPHSLAFAPVPQAAAARGDLPVGAIRRFGTARDRVGNGPIAISPDGRSIVTVSPEGAVRVLDGGSGRVPPESPPPQPPKAFYPDRWAALPAAGSTAVTGVHNADATGNTLTAWNLATREPLWTLTTKNGGTTDHVTLS